MMVSRNSKAGLHRAGTETVTGCFPKIGEGGGPFEVIIYGVMSGYIGLYIIGFGD